MPRGAQGVSGRSALQTQRTSFVRRGNRIFRVTEGCGNGVEEVWVRVTTSAGKVLFSIFKRAREKQGLGIRQCLDSCQLQESEPPGPAREPKDNPGDKGSGTQHPGQKVKTEIWLNYVSA